MFKRVRQYIGESRDELRKVQWPARNEAVYLTFIVIGFSIALAIYLGFFDFIFSYLLKIFVLAP